MADESFALKMLHAIDALIAPKDAPKKEPSPEIMARRAAAEKSMNERPIAPEDRLSNDPLAVQIDRLRRRRKVFSLGTSDEPTL